MLATALSLWTAYAGATSASATQILVAADHAELSAQVSASGVSRVALLGDRIARVIRSPSGYRVEHDPGSGDLYLRPLPVSAGSEAQAEAPVALFVGSEKGFTYRLALTPAERGPAQILIRNPEIAAARSETAAGSDARIAAIVRLVRAVANREPLAGFRIEAGDAIGPAHAAADVVEVWRGLSLSALVLELDAAAPGDAAALAARLGPDIVAVWLAESAVGQAGGRFAVAVREEGLR